FGARAEVSVSDESISRELLAAPRAPDRFLHLAHAALHRHQHRARHHAVANFNSSTPGIRHTAATFLR
ncbi:MAG: hypothetical protein U0793_34240, partial [Gemmataceae bacterium]